MLILSYTKERWALFQLFSDSYDSVKGRQLWLPLTASNGHVSSLSKHVYKKDMRKKKAQKVQTETLETVIRLQHIFMRALTSSKALKIYSSYNCHYFSLQTLMSTLFTDCLQSFLHQKR